MTDEQNELDNALVRLQRGIDDAEASLRKWLHRLEDEELPTKWRSEALDKANIKFNVLRELKAQRKKVLRELGKSYG